VEREAPAGGQVEQARCAGDLGDDGGEAAAGQSLGEHPEGVAGLHYADEDQAPGIEAKTVEANAVGEARFAAGGSLDDPQDRAGVARGEAGEDRCGEAGGGGIIAGEGGADLVEGVAAEAAGKHAVDGRNAQGNKGLGAAKGVVNADAAALDPGDGGAEAVKGTPGHQSAVAHGFSGPVAGVFLICSY